MKELTTEEKAKRYDEAIEVAQKFYNNSVAITKKGLEDIFSELKESEDEKTIKEIKQFIRSRGMSLAQSKVDSWIAWLEKQGDQKPILDVEIPFGAKDSELKDITYDIPKGFHAEIEDDKVVIKEGEQKPAWSEENENIINHLLAICSGAKRYRQFAGCSQDDVTKYQTWLKSLKDRYTWKPSDKQMTALRRMKAAIAGEGEIYEPLNSLYEDLKKLKD